jgi:hypothetical protein
MIDTLGVTGCGGANGVCGSGPGGNTPSFGQPLGFPPAGYSIVMADTVYPAPAGIQDYCNNNSWYNPCWQGDTMVVLTYVRPPQITPGYTVWTAGTGGVSGLASLTDPGTDSARVALLFQERAYWLFLTGHRQEDLRRLLRQYSQWFRSEDQVYPSGAYRGAGTLSYGSAVTAPIPGAEYLNPLFHGCHDRNP